jgi:hypothetical protein
MTVSAKGVDAEELHETRKDAPWETFRKTCSGNVMLEVRPRIANSRIWRGDCFKCLTFCSRSTIYKYNQTIFT